MAPIRVMIVEDSLVIREFLEYLIGQDPRLEVVASVGSGEEALAMLRQAGPDVISMDIRLPGMNGFEATQRIMTERPTPIVVVSASVQAADLKISINALRAGALAVVEKPVGTRHRDYEALAERLCTQLAIMSQIRVIRQRIRRDLPGFPEPVAAANRSPAPLPPGRGEFACVGIVSSTGGPRALQTVLGDLPDDFPVPVLLVQHITGSFLRGFVAWLDELCPLRVVEAAAGEAPRPGVVYVAPADRHLTVEADGLRAGGLRLTDDEPVCTQRPSGTVLLRSLARCHGPRALGVVLTGMGEDGAEGLAAVRRAGGYTLAEDESTTVVYGMPAASARLGAVRESLPLPEIGPRLLQLVGVGR